MDSSSGCSEAPNREELGARVYYTHFVLHNWPDNKCRHILRNLITAMKPNYSKILLIESVLPDTGCPSPLAAGDTNMMSIMGRMKRTEGQRLEVLRSVDLHVVKIWISLNSRNEEAVIEAVLPAFGEVPGWWMASCLAKCTLLKPKHSNQKVARCLKPRTSRPSGR